MRQAIGAAIVLFLLAGTGAVAAPVPHRIMSLKICTDELLMDLARPSQIASVTYLSREKAALKLWPAAARLAVNHNTAEEVLATRPDMILTDTFTPPALRALLAKSGARLVEVPEPHDFAEIRAVTLQVADAVGARPRAQKLLAKMDADLRLLAARRAAMPIRVAGWGGGGFVAGAGTLFNAMLVAAGAVNIAKRDGYYDVEALIAARPDVLAYGDDYVGTPSLRDDQDAHPALLRLFGPRRVTYPMALFSCGVPQSAAADLVLQAKLAAAMRRAAP